MGTGNMVKKFVRANPLDENLNKIKNKTKSVCYGSNIVNEAEPENPGYFFQFILNIKREENSCVPMCLNVVFETELFKTNQDFIDSFEYRKYKNSLGIKDEESEHLGFESVSAKTVVDEKGIAWKKIIITKSSLFSKNLTSSCYNKKILDKISEHVDKPKKFKSKQFFVMSVNAGEWAHFYTVCLRKGQIWFVDFEKCSISTVEPFEKKTFANIAYKGYISWSIWDYMPLKNRDFKRTFN